MPGFSLDMLRSDGDAMTIRMARAYIGFLVAINLLLLSLSVVLNVSVLLGAHSLYSQYGETIFSFAFGVMFPVAFLAKEKNVWRNEFTLCPKWLRAAILFLIGYGVGMSTIDVLYFHGSIALESNALSGTALPFAFESIPLAILYSLLWSKSVEQVELIQRVRISAIALSVGLVIVLALRYNYLRHSIR